VRRPNHSLAALRRRDIDLEGLTVTVCRAQAELQDGRFFDKAPKSAAGVRSVSFPAELLGSVTHHLEHFASLSRPAAHGQHAGLHGRGQHAGADDSDGAQQLSGSADLPAHDQRPGPSYRGPAWGHDLQMRMKRPPRRKEAITSGLRRDGRTVGSSGGGNMADRGWYDDSGYHEAVQRAERATRFGWSAIAWTTGVLGCVLITIAVLCVVAVLACLFVVVSSHY
jgi:hypothetical protein